MTTLAEYNNNPGNIRPAPGVKYEGLIGVDDKGFGIFEKPEYGQKALINDITYKLEKRGIKTPNEFVDIYSPKGDENSEDSRDNYKIYIAQKLGLKSTNDPFPENAVEKLSQAITNFEGGKWQESEEKNSIKSAPTTTQSNEDSSNQYSGKLIPNETTQEAKKRSAIETGAISAAVGAGLGSVVAVKAPIIRTAQRVGLLPGGKAITPADAVKLTEQVMNIDSPVAAAEAASRKTHGGENWQKSLTGISTPGAQMDKASLDLAKGMNRAVTGGAPGFTGGKITEGGIIINPRDAAVINQKLELEAAEAARQREILLKNASESDARFKQMLQQANSPNTFVQKAQQVASSSPVKGGLAGLGLGFNAQDAYNKFDQGDYLGGSLATGAAGASLLGVVPRLASTMNPAAIGLTTASQVAGDLGRGDRQSAAESGLTGLTALLPRLFGPISAGLYSRGLNANQEEELARYRKMKPPHLRP